MGITTIPTITLSKSSRPSLSQQSVKAAAHPPLSHKKALDFVIWLTGRAVRARATELNNPGRYV